MKTHDVTVLQPLAFVLRCEIALPFWLLPLPMASIFSVVFVVTNGFAEHADSTARNFALRAITQGLWCAGNALAMGTAFALERRYSWTDLTDLWHMSLAVRAGLVVWLGLIFVRVVALLLDTAIRCTWPAK